MSEKHFKYLMLESSMRMFCSIPKTKVTGFITCNQDKEVKQRLQVKEWTWKRLNERNYLRETNKKYKNDEHVLIQFTNVFIFIRLIFNAHSIIHK